MPPTNNKSYIRKPCSPKPQSQPLNRKSGDGILASGRKCAAWPKSVFIPCMIRHTLMRIIEVAIFPEGGRLNSSSLRYGPMRETRIAQQQNPLSSPLVTCTLASRIEAPSNHTRKPHKSSENPKQTLKPREHPKPTIPKDPLNRHG